MSQKSSPSLITFIFISAFFGILGGFLTVVVIWHSFILENADNHLVVKENVIEKTYIEESSIIDTVKKISPSVVSVVITKDLDVYHQMNPFFNPFLNDPFLEEFFGQRPGIQAPEHLGKQKVGGGTGFIITKDGLILTNKHVVSDEEAQYTVILADGKELPAEVLGRDMLNDLAVLQIKAPEDQPLNLQVVSFGDSENLQVGQKVVAIGNALAEFQNTVTSGVISAFGRQIEASDGRGEASSLSGLIQTDAAINPGNSGGPLVNLNGEVIGVNTAIASGASGIGFAIPINDVKSIIDSVAKYGRIVRPYIGVRYLMLDAEKGKELEIDLDHGALLVGDESKGLFAVIPGSPGEKAGLEIKDVILSVNGESLKTDQDLRSVIAKYQVDDELELEVWRSGKVMKVMLKLEEAK